MFSKIKFLLLFGAFSFGGGLFYLSFIPFNSSLNIFESEESKALDLRPVYNKILWISTPSRDIWMMNQSHFGMNAHSKQWERLAIIIDKTTSLKTARFYQFTPGPLEWNENLINQRRPYRASCFTCHSNGPRAVRPQFSSPSAPLAITDKIKISLWNLRIKTYGRIRYDESHNKEDVALVPPFHFEGHGENDELKIATCIKCHREEGFLARGTLVRQHAGTIQRMVKNGHMPPTGFSLSKSEKKQLKDFLHGF
jgi:hypothetical protein